MSIDDLIENQYEYRAIKNECKLMCELFELEVKMQ